MTANQWKSVLKTARQLQKEEEKIDKTLRDFCTALSPGAHSIYVEKGMVYGYLEAIKATLGDTAHEHVSYWLYEVPLITKDKGKCEVKDQHGRKYDANNLGSYVKFILTV